jgi:hypothetical protein
MPSEIVFQQPARSALAPNCRLPRCSDFDSYRGSADDRRCSCQARPRRRGYPVAGLLVHPLLHPLTAVVGTNLPIRNVRYMAAFEGESDKHLGRESDHEAPPRMFAGRHLGIYRRGIDRGRAFVRSFAFWINDHM